MPNTKSAKKDMRTSKIKNARNKAVKSTIRNAIKDVEKNIGTGSREEQESSYKSLCSVVDKAVKKGIIKANTAAKHKSKASRKIKTAA